MTTAMWARAAEEERIATLNVALSFVDSATSGEVICRSTVDRRTRHVGAVRCELRHEDGDRLLATALATFAISARRPA
jgi:acyl-coenzyme A thioesterase PaaI-like protein